MTHSPGRMQGKVVLVIGAGSVGPGWGNGRAIAKGLAHAGAKVIVTDIHVGNAQAVAQEISQSGGQAWAFELDVTSEVACKQLAEKVEKQIGLIDVLVNNAGITKDARLVNMTEQQFDAVIDVNLKGVFNCTQAVAPHMLKAGKGSIVSASSVVGLYGNFGQTNYAATKFGVIGFTMTWARELGPKGVRVNAVCPGFIETSILSTIPDDVLNGMKERSWLRRLGQPEEMANVYLFLASDESSYINGVALEASGGISL